MTRFNLKRALIAVLACLLCFNFSINTSKNSSFGTNETIIPQKALFFNGIFIKKGSRTAAFGFIQWFLLKIQSYRRSFVI